MLEDAGESVRALLDDTALEPDAVADAVVAGLADERFLILRTPKSANTSGGRPTTTIGGCAECVAFSKILGDFVNGRLGIALCDWPLGD